MLGPGVGVTKAACGTALQLQLCHHAVLPVPELAFPHIQFIWAAPVRILLFESSGGSWEKPELSAHPGVSKIQRLFHCKVTKFFLGFCLEKTSDLLLCLK